ncbi:hypothetical protein NUU61_004198 [Penicillium alfredii]|uniref:Uncharacterized protein n=1 Tax=Penicillium alfredii TaxID=1506179 RepID=A0A9W9FKN8_9EURO|nr:uncharacterized protein NUU61_004198 [Penicillium alfredii]KAJ5101976.1 hypothetical protein NUU61_004198 [Penicillium alfredii]
MSTMTTLERSHSCTSSNSLSMSSPRLSVRHEHTPSADSEISLIHLHDRMNQLDSLVLELRSTFLTKEGYVDRRNREDDYIRREFENHRAISHRIDLNVVALRTDVDQVKSGIFQLKSSTNQAGTETVFLRGDVDRLQKSVDQLQSDMEQMRADVCASRIDISKLQTVTSQLRTEMMTLEHKMSHQLTSMNTRMDSMYFRMDSIDSRMKHSERVRFNSLAQTIHAPINPVPFVTDDGSLEWPQYFPRTVWRFWCLKKRSRVHRLVELAEFYRLGGYEDWSRMHQSESLFGNDSDASDSSDASPDLTRAEAVRQYPEAAHQALAATLGLVYYKIRNEVGEGPNARALPRPPKRQQEDVASVTSSTKSKPAKMACRPNVSRSYLHQLVTGPSVESKSTTSEEFDKLGWNAFSDVSEDAMSKLRAIDPQDVGTVLRALEQGRLKLKPSRSERLNMSPTESKTSHPSSKAAMEPAQEDVIPTEPNTVPTQPVSPSAVRAELTYVPDIPDTASDS